MILRFLVIWALALSAVIAVACSQPSAPATPLPSSTIKPAPTATSTAVALPTQQPIATVRKKPDFPQPGKSVTIVVPGAVGGVADAATRLLAPAMERQLGVPVEVSNRIGNAANTALAEFAGASPDGYSLMIFTVPSTLATYLDPGRKSSFGRSDFVPVAGAFADRLVIAVRTESNFAIPSDVVDYSKAKPGDFAVGTNGNFSAGHLGALAWAQKADVSFSFYPFPSSIEAIARLLIGRLDAAAVTVSSLGANVKAGHIRLLGVMDDQESPLLPGVPTFSSQGFGISAPAYYFLAAPAGTPRDVVDVLSASVKKATESEAYRNRLAEIGVEARYMATDELAAYWTDRENWTRPLLEAARR